MDNSKYREVDILSNIFENIIKNKNFKRPDNLDRYGKQWEHLFKEIGNSMYYGLINIKTIGEVNYYSTKKDLNFGDLLIEYSNSNFKSYVDLKMAESRGDFPGSTIKVNSEKYLILEAWYLSISRNLKNGFLIKHEALRDMVDNGLIYPNSVYYYSTDIVYNIHKHEYDKKGLAKILDLGGSL